MRQIIWLAVLLAWLAAPRVAHSAVCDELSAEGKALAAKLFAATHPYDCCDETLDRCLKQKKVCRLARRLRDDICRRVKVGQDEAKIKSALEKRARAMTPIGKKASFDLAGADPVGAAAAKITVVAYACSRCPMCARVMPDLHGLATSGPLKGKVRVYLRTYPLRDHAGSVEGGLAFLAAQKQKKLWPFLLKLYAEFKSFSADKLPTWAAQVGLDRAAFVRELASPATRQQLVEAKREGLRNGIEQTPTLFINGRRYQGPVDHASLLDVLEEELDRLERRLY
jgi:protein-disulfide isomerase